MWLLFGGVLAFILNVPMRAIENGILKSYLVDKHNSKKMNHPITASSRRESYKHMPTSRMTNTYFLNGESTFEEIIAKFKNINLVCVPWSDLTGFPKGRGLEQASYRT